MTKEHILTQAAFDKFLDWLGPDREQAGKKYEDIRRRLIKLFTCRGCAEAEELTDETINRVIEKAPEMADTYVGDPTAYFYTVAKYVYLEYTKRKPYVAPPPPPDPSDELEKESRCLDECMEKIPPNNRDLILLYYRQEKQTKIDYRKQLADQLGIGMNALRIKMCRIRASLEECLVNCVGQEITK